MEGSWTWFVGAEKRDIAAGLTRPNGWNSAVTVEVGYWYWLACWYCCCFWSRGINCANWLRATSERSRLLVGSASRTLIFFEAASLFSRFNSAVIFSRDFVLNSEASEIAEESLLSFFFVGPRGRWRAFRSWGIRWNSLEAHSFWGFGLRFWRSGRLLWQWRSSLPYL